ncbi:hypothetical protein GCM10009116_04160 [Brevundimonas basaltis]|uniref:Uncharacterized protein n=1 Tax=Brevundimonas basaltis TaxID=472166 RepID=A0A7W8HZK5_9CAUL|nr:hypothetical protein [Brevundimonas basaltis]MBB5292685.1 hypothetical protein [Brevundimonas basaltis]
MTPGQKPKRPFGLGAYLLLIGGVSLIAGVMGGITAVVEEAPDPIGPVVSAVAMTATMAAAFAACIWWWRGIDEAAREAHKWAWWWGGTGGTALGAILLTTLSLRDAEATPLQVGLTVPELVTAGMLTILLFQIAGYAIAWAVWWLRTR